MSETGSTHKNVMSVAGIEPAALRPCFPQRSDLTPNRYGLVRMDLNNYLTYIKITTSTSERHYIEMYLGLPTVALNDTANNIVSFPVGMKMSQIHKQ